MKYLTLEKGEGEYAIRHVKGKCIGTISSLSDGFYYYWPLSSTEGYLPSYILLEIVGLLDILNKDLTEDLDRYFTEEEIDEHSLYNE